MEDDEKSNNGMARVVTSDELLQGPSAGGHIINVTAAKTDADSPTDRAVLRFFSIVTAVAVALPVLLTIIGAVTNPPRAAHILSGHLLYLTGDEPSEHTTTLRGLFIVNSQGNSRLLAHDTEPQDTDGGTRSWIDEPTVSPDGKYVAYLQDQILLEEEIQKISQQLWVIPVASDNKSPVTTLDLTKLGYKRAIGLTWSPDSRSVEFAQDHGLVQVTPGSGDKYNLTTMPLKLPQLSWLQPTKDLPTLSYPRFDPEGKLTVLAKTTGGQVLLTAQDPGLQKWKVIRSKTVGYGLSQDGMEAALVPAKGSNRIDIVTASTGTIAEELHAKWGWSVFGGREITSVAFSPDRKFLLYTVSKPPVPEEEMFLIERATDKVSMLPYRTGRASWTWVK